MGSYDNDRDNVTHSDVSKLLHAIVEQYSEEFAQMIRTRYEHQPKVADTYANSITIQYAEASKYMVNIIMGQTDVDSLTEVDPETLVIKAGLSILAPTDDRE